MALPVYPPDLPQFFLLGFNEVRQPNYVESGVDVGIPKRRKRFTEALVSFPSVSFYLDYEQKAILDEFYNENGATEWEYVDPSTEETIICQFVSAPTYTYSVPLQVSFGFKVIPE